MLPIVMLLTWLLLLPACSSKYSSIIPPEMEAQVDDTLSFAQLHESPMTHRGKVVVVAGEVLSATRLVDRTRMTMLQLPFMKNYEPTTDRLKSEGRFMAFQTEFLDPATVPTGSRVTIVGEVSGANTELLDEMKYTYPTLTIKHLKIWPEAMLPPYWDRRYGRPYYGYPYWWYARPYRGFGRFYAFRPYRYGYWW
ncbi:MAG: membrane protein [Nitrospirales bacterium]|nr:MAG: membrane protein [Nitrospirales bacterium]